MKAMSQTLSCVDRLELIFSDSFVNTVPFTMLENVLSDVYAILNNLNRQSIDDIKVSKHSGRMF
jgi:hypothetical protein